LLRVTKKECQAMRLYIGTYTRRGGEGIYVCHLDMSTGALEILGAAGARDNPSYLALHPSGRYLYAINEVAEFGGRTGGGVSAYAIDPETGALTLLNQQSSIGTEPCYVTVDLTGRYVLVANYAGGSVCVLPMGDGGELESASDFVQHEGSSVLPRRQEAAHAHSIVVDPTNRYVYVPDLGMDRIVVYRLDLEEGRLLTNESQPYVSVTPGYGPRHFAFHPSGRYACVINEIGNAINVYRYDDRKGTLAEIQTVTTLPDGFEGRSHTADIHFAPSGAFLYGSNRGHDSIVIYAVDGETGQLTLVGHEPTRGHIPRNFLIDPTGTWLLAANQNSDNVVTFCIDPQTGELEPTGHEIAVPMPVCIKALSPTEGG
jgi:6-phosphogluconolactonase